MGLGLAFRAFFAALGGGSRAERIRRALVPDADQPAEPGPGGAVAAAKPAGTDARSALLLLSTLQEKGRLIDFLNEELDGLDDADIGAATRAVHAGCKEALSEYFELAPIADAAEGAEMDVGADLDPVRIKLVGTGTPPIRGTVSHRGWQVLHIDLPKLTGELEHAKVVAPVQVDVNAS